MAPGWPREPLEADTVGRPDRRGAGPLPRFASDHGFDELARSPRFQKQIAQPIEAQGMD